MTGRALADLSPFEIHTAHARVRRERHESGSEGFDVALAKVEFLLGEHHHGAAFRGFIGEGCELSGVGELAFGHAGRVQEISGLPVAERDGAGFVEQQDVDVARGFHGASGDCNHVRAQHPPDAGEPDRREQPADRRWDQAHQQRHEDGDGDRVTRFGDVHRVDRERQQRDRGEHEDQRHLDQQDGERDLVGRPLPTRALDHGDHAVEEGLAQVHRDAHDEPVGEHARAARHGGKIPARFADHGCGLAGDRRFVHRRDALDHFAVSGNEVARFDEKHVALL